MAILRYWDDGKWNPLPTGYKKIQPINNTTDFADEIVTGLEEVSSGNGEKTLNYTVKKIPPIKQYVVSGPIEDPNSPGDETIPSECLIYISLTQS